MSNNEFIKKYGKRNYYDLKEVINQILFVKKANKEIGGYKISNRKGIVSIYIDKIEKQLDFADIWYKEKRGLKW